jgi:hypothetical protein
LRTDRPDFGQKGHVGINHPDLPSDPLRKP